jgi:hypothetical protein
MFKPPRWVQPRSKRRVTPLSWLVRYTCACGQKGLGIWVEKGKEPNWEDIHCQQCVRLEEQRQRRERHRLAMRRWRGSDVPHDDRSCPQCGSIFTPERSTAHYCSTRCRVAAHRAKLAGQTRPAAHKGEVEAETP